MRDAVMDDVLKTIICPAPYLKWMPDKDDQKILCLGYMRPVTDKDTK